MPREMLRQRAVLEIQTVFVMRDGGDAMFARIGRKQISEFGIADMIERQFGELGREFAANVAPAALT